MCPLIMGVKMKERKPRVVPVLGGELPPLAQESHSCAHPFKRQNDSSYGYRPEWRMRLDHLCRVVAAVLLHKVKRAEDGSECNSWTSRVQLLDEMRNLLSYSAFS